MKFSVIIPSYNQGRFLKSCLESILDQDYEDVEIIIFDGGSTDSTVSVIQSFKTLKIRWFSEPDSGQSDALNKCLNYVSGDIIGWMNCDDRYSKEAFSRVRERFEADPSVQIVYGDWAEIDIDGSCVAHKTAFDFCFEHLVFEGFHLNSQAFFVSKRVISLFSGFDKDLHFTMDYQFLVELGLKVPISNWARIPEPLAEFRRHDNQKTIGFTAAMEREHRLIAMRYGFSEKFHMVGTIKRFKYRLRRLFWYVRRRNYTALRAGLLSKITLSRVR